MRKRLLLIAVAVAIVPGAILVLHHRQPATKPGVVSANGFTLKSASITLATDDPLFPDGPHADAVNANCTACHSASMALTQPKLKPEQWQATVKKMREVYKAPIADADVPAILAYLEAMPSQQADAP